MMWDKTYIPFKFEYEILHKVQGILQLSTLVDLDSQLDWHKFNYGLIELHIFCA